MPTASRSVIATLATLALFAAAAHAADDADDVIEVTARATVNPDAVNRDLARRAHTAAVEDAVAALLAANKLHLDMLLDGRTSADTPENTVASR